MNTLGNILWFFLGGFIIVLLYLLGSLILIITIIGIPFGFETLKMAGFALAPFGREVLPGQRAGGCLYLALNILWIIFAGIELAIIHLVLALLFAITIIGIPFAKQHIKMATLALMPFGMDIRDVK
jgi:uncharacterized membrane protein YccF (DUF307 family)